MSRKFQQHYFKSLILAYDCNYHNYATRVTGAYSIHCPRVFDPLRDTFSLSFFFSQMQPSMLLKLLRKLTVDVSKLSEYTTVALRVGGWILSNFSNRIFVNQRWFCNFPTAADSSLRSLREILRLDRRTRRVRCVERRRETSDYGPFQQHLRLVVQDGLRPRIVWEGSTLPHGHRLRATTRLFVVEELRRRVVWK